MLHAVKDVEKMIEAGKPLLLAGNSAALAQLPAGCWIGGSASYFMDEAGGAASDSLINVTELPVTAGDVSIRIYHADELAQMYTDAPENGFTFLLIPAESSFLKTFAERASLCEGFLLKPVVGWVTGVPVNEIGKQKPVVVDGFSRQGTSEYALAMHVPLPASQFAELEIVNIFKPGDGDVITFPKCGFVVKDCLVNGKPVNLSEYVTRHKIDPRLPMVGDYNGSNINVSLQKVDEEAHEVHLYAPVFDGVEYRFAEPIADYSEAFGHAIPHSAHALFSCNCILNYLHGELEGKPCGTITGPVTFGEIAHLLLNQTLVQLRIREV